MIRSIVLVFLIISGFVGFSQKTSRTTFLEERNNFDNYKLITSKKLAVYLPEEMGHLKDEFDDALSKYWTHSKYFFVSTSELGTVFKDTNNVLLSFIRISSDREEAFNLERTVNYLAISYSMGYCANPEDYAARTLIAMRLQGGSPKLTDENPVELFDIKPIVSLMIKHLNYGVQRFSMKAPFFSEENLDFGLFPEKPNGDWDIQGEAVLEPEKISGKTVIVPAYALNPRFNKSLFESRNKRRHGISDFVWVSSPEELDKILKQHEENKNISYLYFMPRNALNKPVYREFGSLYAINNGEFLGHISSSLVRNRGVSTLAKFGTAITLAASAYVIPIVIISLSEY